MHPNVHSSTIYNIQKPLSLATAPSCYLCPLHGDVTISLKTNATPGSTISPPVFLSSITLLKLPTFSEDATSRLLALLFTLPSDRVRIGHQPPCWWPFWNTTSQSLWWPPISLFSVKHTILWKSDWLTPKLKHTSSYLRNTLHYLVSSRDVL